MKRTLEMDQCLQVVKLHFRRVDPEDEWLDKVICCSFCDASEIVEYNDGVVKGLSIFGVDVTKHTVVEQARLGQTSALMRRGIDRVESLLLGGL